MKKKIILTLATTLLLVVNIHAQPGQNYRDQTDFDFPESGPPVPVDLPDYTNINNEAAVSYQDAKRAVFHMTKLGSIGNGIVRNVSCFLVNTVSQNKRPYMLTTARFLALEASVGDEKNVSLTPNYELPESNGSLATKFFQRRWKCTIRILVLDRDADIVLFEVLDNSRVYKGLYNAYALGWKVSRAEDNTITANISHPGGGHKQILLDPFSSSYSYFKKDRTLSGFKGGGKAYNVSWDGVYSYPSKGSFGSPLLNDEKQAVGLHSRTGQTDASAFVFPSLSKSWYYQEKTDTQPAGLIDYLDPDHTWVTDIPGGYWADLDDVNTDQFTYDVPTDDAILLKADHQVTWKDVNPNFPIEDAESSYPPFGLKIKERPAGSSLLLFATTEIDGEEYFFWGVKADGSNVDAKSGFEASEFNPNTAFTFDSQFSDLKELGDLVDHNASLEISTSNIKEAMLAILHSDPQAVSDISELTVPIKIYLKRLDANSGPVGVTAWGIPGTIPQNVKQTINPDDIKYSYDYMKYPSFAPQNTNNLYINLFNVAQNVRNKNHPNTDGLGGKHFSGDNGGYLNLVSPLQYIGAVKTSYKNLYTDKVPQKMRLKLEVQTPGLYHYKVWIDYGKDFNFTGTVPTHPELILTGTAQGGTINEVEYELPLNDDLGIENEKSKAYRLRVAISTTSPDPTGQGQMQDGEVEDYLIKLSGPKVADLLISTSGKRMMGIDFGPEIEDNEQQDVLPDQVGGCPAPAGGYAATAPPNQGLLGAGDAVAPYACNALVCIDNSCDPTSFLEDEIKRVGHYSANFDGSAILKIDEEDLFVHEQITERALNFWVLLKDDVDYSGKMMLYDEGGSGNGFGIRINGSQIELGVDDGSGLETIQAPLPPDTGGDPWVNITAQFAPNRLEVYVNETKYDKTIDIASIPEHLDEAGFAGTNGTNVFNNETHTRYNGYVDHIIVLSELLTQAGVSLVVNQALSPSARIAAVSKEVLEADYSTAPQKEELLVFPNPTLDKVNIIVSLTEDGSIHLEIYDLVGYKVYELNQPELEKGSHQITLQNLNLPSGQYLVRYRSKTTEKVAKLIIKNGY